MEAWNLFLVLVSKDDDFRQLSLLHGTPPKVVLCSIHQTFGLIQENLNASPHDVNGVTECKIRISSASSRDYCPSRLPARRMVEKDFTRPAAPGACHKP